MKDDAEVLACASESVDLLLAELEEDYCGQSTCGEGPDWSC